MTNSAGPEFVLSGGRVGTSMLNQAWSGDYWSSFAVSATANAYNLRVTSSGNVYPVDTTSKDRGLPLRCLAPPTPSTNYSLTPLDQTLC